MRTVSLAVALAPVCVWPTHRAAAGGDVFHVFTPVIETGHWGVELNTGLQSGFPSPDEDEAHGAIRAAAELGVHVDVSPFWMAKVALDIEREVGGDTHLSAIASENVFRFDKWSPRAFDVGWFTSVAAAISDDATNAIEFGPVFQLNAGDVALMLNPFLEKSFGQNREEGMAFVYAFRATYALREQLSVGLEAYGEVEDIANAPATAEQVHRIGPVVYFGSVHGMGHGSHSHDDHGYPETTGPDLRLDQANWYAEVGVLFGLTDSTPDAALKLNAGFHF